MNNDIQLISKVTQGPFEFYKEEETTHDYSFVALTESDYEILIELINERKKLKDDLRRTSQSY